jgi:organic radical activating enzyme
MPVQVIPSSEAQLLEVFSSIQGEGGLIGCRQIFVRMAGCNLDCAYCDTDFSPQDYCRIEDAPGSGQFRNVPNPVSLEVLAGIIAQWVERSPGMHHSISLTGGEPLLQGGVLQEWLPVLRDILPVHLETNGTCPKSLEALVPYIEWISMDVKLASVTGVATPWQLHQSFLELAGKTRVWVKAVVAEETTDEEMRDLGRLVHQIAPDVTVCLQPVTRGGKVDMSNDHLLALQASLSGVHGNIRVIPQTHVFLGLL